MILIVSTPGDEHALAVQAELSRRKAQSKLLDLSEFPQNLGLSIRYKAGEGSFAFGCEGSSLDLEECGAIWWRRPQQPQISSDILRTTHRHFAFNESVEALQGLWHALQPFWINDPARDYVAQRKVYQLRVAQEVGLTVPETLITNCTRAAGDFVRQQGAGRVIYKSFSALENEWRETRLLAENEVQLLDNVRYAPVIFQEYIEARWICELQLWARRSLRRRCIRRILRIKWIAGSISPMRGLKRLSCRPIFRKSCFR